MVGNKNSVIGKDISSVPNKHKPYFEVDANNTITSYKRQICIDRVELKAMLSSDEIEDLLAGFNYHVEQKVQPNGFTIIRNIIDLREYYGVYIKIQPYNKGVNAEIQLHSKFTNNLQGNSSVIIDILKNPKWFITRLDIATDYTTPFNNSAYLRRNGNQKQKNFSTSSWSGSTANPNKTAVNSHYDRKVEDKSLDSNSTNRFEVKMYFKERDNMTFANLNHALIIERLKAELFIPCLKYSNFHEKKVKTNKGQKDFIDLIKLSKGADNENYVRLLLTNSQWQTYRSHFKACRDEIENLYVGEKNMIYDFLLARQ